MLFYSANDQFFVDLSELTTHCKLPVDTQLSAQIGQRAPDPDRQAGLRSEALQPPVSIF